MCRTGLLTAALAALLGPAAWAESLLLTLPEDGAWAQYRVIIVRNGQEDPPYEWTIRSVGRQQLGGEDHRWLELQSKQNGVNVVLFRALVPEKEFGPGKNPIAAIKKTWVKYDDQPPREIESVASVDPFLALILEGPVANLKTEENKEPLDYPAGRLECTVQTGTHETSLAGFTWKVFHRVLKSDKTPFGVAAMTQEFTGEFNGQKQGGRVTCTLEKIGKDAKSELTEAN